MRNRTSLTWRQVIAGSLIALGLAAALANMGKAQMAKADETPPADWREAGAYLPGGDTVNQTWKPPKITAVSQ
jgi:hypothetical protein